MRNGAGAAQHVIQRLQFLAALVQRMDRAAAQRAHLPFVAFDHVDLRVHAVLARGTQGQVRFVQGAHQQAVHPDDLHQRMHVLVHQRHDPQVALTNAHAGAVGLVARHLGHHRAVRGVQVVLHAAQRVVHFVGGHVHAQRVHGLHTKHQALAGALQCGDVSLDDLRRRGQRIVVEEVQQLQQGLRHHVVRTAFLHGHDHLQFHEPLPGGLRLLGHGVAEGADQLAHLRLADVAGFHGDGMQQRHVRSTEIEEAFGGDLHGSSSNTRPARGLNRYARLQRTRHGAGAELSTGVSIPVLVHILPAAAADTAPFPPRGTQQAPAPRSFIRGPGLVLLVPSAAYILPPMLGCARASGEVLPPDGQGLLTARSSPEPCHCLATHRSIPPRTCPEPACSRQASRGRC